MKKVLFISYTNFVSNTYTGGQKVSLKNYQMNKTVFGEDNVDVIIFDRDIEEKQVNHFTFVQSSSSRLSTFMNCFLGYARGYSKHCEDAIISKLKDNKYDLLYIDFSGYGISLKRIRKYYQGEIITFFHDVEFYYEKNRARHESKLYYLSAFAIRKAEKGAIMHSDYIIALNSRDHVLIQKTYNREPDLDLPVAFTDVADASMLVEKRCDGTLLFVGSDFGPNIDGLRWFTKDIMPYVNKPLKVIGKGLEKYKEEMQADNVDIIGTVDDLSEYYYKAAAVVLPIRYGDGMKVKTAEALMYGRTVIGTKEAFEGYDIQNSIEGYYCDNAQIFIKTINDLEKEGYNESARKLFLSKYSLESSIQDYYSLLNKERQEG